MLQRLISQIKGGYQMNLVAMMQREGFMDVALKSLHSRSARSRHAACTVLSYFSDPAAIAALGQALKDENLAVRIVAAHALIQKDQIDFLPQLLADLKFSPEDPPLIMAEIFARLPNRLWSQAIQMLDNPIPDEWKRMLAIALGRNHAAEAIPALHRLSQHPSGRVRAAAWVAFLELGDAQAGKYVMEGLKDPSATVRQAACRCAGAFGDPESSEYLVGLLQDEDWWVRFAAAQGLYDLGGTSRECLEDRTKAAADNDVALLVLREREMEALYGL